jgi:hypothetical protein
MIRTNRLANDREREKKLLLHLDRNLEALNWSYSMALEKNWKILSKDPKLIS